MVIFCLSLPYLIMYLAFMKVPYLHLATKWGDFSYGVYLYAFPVQQMVMTIERRQPTWMPFPLYVAICSVITLGLAILSWFLVEKPMLKLKKKTLHPVGSAPRTVAPDARPSSGSHETVRSADPTPASATNRVMGVP
jgi:peptidoglycan/LPS O-acetylase OafA/YrhL